MKTVAMEYDEAELKRMLAEYYQAHAAFTAQLEECLRNEQDIRARRSFYEAGIPAMERALAKLTQDAIPEATANGTLEHYMAQEYPIEVQEVPAELGGGYSASIPCLGSMAFFAVGETESEALAELDEVKAVLFKDMLDRGKAIPAAPVEAEKITKGRRE